MVPVPVFLAVLFAALLHAGWNAVLKLGLDRFSSILFLALVQGGIALALLPFFAVPSQAAWPWILAGSGLHSGYKLVLIRAYSHGDLSQIYPLARGAAPLIVALVGALVLGENLSILRLAALLSIAAGIMLMARIAALIGALLALPAIVFVAVNLLKYGFGVDGPYDALASATEKADGTLFFDTPWLLLGGPLIALLLNLFTLVRPRLRRDGPGAALVAIDLRFSWSGLTVILLAAAALALLAAHLAAEIVHKIALGASL